MSKRLERPNGYFQTFDEHGRKIEGETRQCAHCGFMWMYNPLESFKKKLTGEYKPVIRGKCLKCYGLTCEQPQCKRLGCVPQMKRIELMERAAKQHNGILLL
jgi:hypothetical protein